jgi:transposase
MTLPVDLNRLSRGELIQIIYAQKDELDLLATQIADLRARIDHQGPPQKTPPSWVKPNTKTKIHHERKQRDHGFARTLDIPTKRIIHSLDRCPDCNDNLGKPVVAYARQVIDIPVTPMEITEHIIYKRWCFRCKKQVQPTVDFSASVVGKQRIGIRLTSMITVLREACRQPIATIQKYLSIIYGLSVSRGELIELLHKTAHRGQTQYARLKETIRGSPHIHGDETGGRENGKNGYWWSFNTKEVHYLLYRKSRSKHVVEEVLGDAFDRVLSSDFYAAYNTYTGFHQRCWVHFLRDIHERTEEYPKDKKLKRWARRVHMLYEQAKAYGGPDPLLPIGTQQRERIEKQQHFENALRALCTPWVKTEAPMSTLAARGITFLQELFVFVRFPGIPSDNNPAERALRHMVVSRKISGGMRSSRGSQTKAILSSLFGTWRLQNKNPFQECQLLLAGVSGV